MLDNILVRYIKWIANETTNNSTKNIKIKQQLSQREIWNKSTIRQGLGIKKLVLLHTRSITHGAVVEDIYNFSLLNDLIYKISITNNILTQN